MNTLIHTHPYIFMTFFILMTLSIGSLLNVIIFRLPQMLNQTEHLNLWFPRSFCPNCKSKIPAWYNIPILSYCFLHGRCHNCSHKISWQYPCVELLCLILSLYAVYIFGINLKLVCALLFIYYCICIIFIDLKHYIIPDSLSLGLLWLGLMANTQNTFISLSNAVWSAICAYLCLWILIKTYAIITNKIGMGNGDFKLFAAFGAWFGVAELPSILLISSLLGAVTGIIYLKITRQGRNTLIPYGPFLCIAGLIILFRNSPF
jgi:leader peptidase (prepilin peptidase) / N-methyltransferase